MFKRLYQIKTLVVGIIQKTIGQRHWETDSGKTGTGILTQDLEILVEEFSISPNFDWKTQKISKYQCR